jgi:hypothetical protein
MAGASTPPTRFRPASGHGLKVRARLAYLVGEVIHGDYRQIIATAGLASVTQDELWEVIWSSLNVLARIVALADTAMWRAEPQMGGRVLGVGRNLD